jgi:hypothetical protein
MNISIGAGNGTHDAESFYKRVIAGADPGFQAKGVGRTYKNCAERREALKFLGYFV